jgi:hypothetical protein
MKKLLFVLAIVAVYGLSISPVSANVIIAEKAQVSIVDDTNITPEGEKEKPAAKKAKAKKAEAKAEGCSEAKKAECSAAEKKACGEEKK